MRNRSDAVGRSRISIPVSIPLRIPAPGIGEVGLTVTYRIDAFATGTGEAVAGYVGATPVQVTRDTDPGAPGEALLQGRTAAVLWEVHE